MKYLLAILIISLTIFGVSFLNSDKEGEVLEETAREIQLTKVKIDNQEFDAEVLDDERERVQGLSGRVSLESDRVMLFVFEEETYPGIWMKEMRFPIDIAWSDKEGKIIHIEKNVSPDTFPKVFFPPAKSLYVLETNADFFDLHQIEKGDLVQTKI